MTLREATAADAAFLVLMLVEAATWDRPAGATTPPADDILADPRCADYVVDWGRDGDAGVIAERDGTPVGACWFRRFTSDRPGYGFLGEEVAGLGLAVLLDHRGRGIGRRLLDTTITLAQQRGVAALGLSVAAANVAARSLYDRGGFVVVGREGGSLTMRRDLDARPT